mmetsp:Transcript_22973/g.63728  ORF Transcript_22973/g.63728 Transcript_22973/m.63728 type:complete len:99 (+) Transcript_22973:81-377(+)
MPSADVTSNLIIGSSTDPMEQIHSFVRSFIHSFEPNVRRCWLFEIERTPSPESIVRFGSVLFCSVRVLCCFLLVKGKYGSLLAGLVLQSRALSPDRVS